MAVTINGTTGIAGVDGSASTPAVQGSDTNTGIFFPAADTIAFGEGGAEAMRIDSSGNVGIGTSTPAVKLDVVGAISASGAIQASGVATNLYPIVSGTAITLTNQTAPEFTGIPSWVKRITVMFSGVSTNGTSNLQIQLGDSGGIETSGYAGSCDSRTSSAFYTNGFLVTNGVSAAATHNVLATIGLLGANTWCISGVKASASTDAAMFFAGSKTLSDTLTQVRITTVNGTDTFDAGTINILYE